MTLKKGDSTGGVFISFCDIRIVKSNIDDGLKTSNKSVSEFPGLVKTPLFAINKSMVRMDSNVIDAEEKETKNGAKSTNDKVFFKSRTFHTVSLSTQRGRIADKRIFLQLFFSGESIFCLK